MTREFITVSQLFTEFISGGECPQGKATISRRTCYHLCRRSLQRDNGLRQQRKRIFTAAKRGLRLTAERCCCLSPVLWGACKPCLSIWSGPETLLKLRQEKVGTGAGGWHYLYLVPCLEDLAYKTYLRIQRMIPKRIQKFALEVNWALYSSKQRLDLEGLLSIFQRCARNNRRFFDLSDTSSRKFPQDTLMCTLTCELGFWMSWAS